MAATQLFLEIGPYEIQKSYFTSPLKLGTPRTAGGRQKIVLMMASAGVLKGDAFEYYIRCHKGTNALITEQSYTKIFDMGGGSAKRRSTLFWMRMRLFFIVRRRRFPLPEAALTVPSTLISGKPASCSTRIS